MEVYTPRKFNLKQKLQQKNKIIHHKIVHISKLKKEVVVLILIIV